MKKIINNPNRLTDEQMDIKTTKTRAIIIDEDNKIILTKYFDIYMLPGGKLDPGENIYDALKREVQEEVGIDIDINNLNPLLEVNNYLKDYPIRDTGVIANKFTKTTYFVLRVKTLRDVKDLKLTESERRGGFSIYKVTIDELINLVKNHQPTNPRDVYFSEELLQVIEEYQIQNRDNSNNDLIDLHIHTNYSDGELSPNEVIKLVKKRNVSTFSITDHDTVMAYRNMDYSLLDGLNLIAGIELSVKSDVGQIHILGYGIDTNNNALNNKLIELRDNSIYSVYLILEQIKKDYNIIFNDFDVQNLLNSSHVIGRVDVAKLCIKYGYVKTVQEAFDKYLVNAYENCRSKKKWISYEEAIELILNARGIPVLAHPKTLNLSDKELYIKLKEMISAGLQGIEVYHSSHSPKETEYYLRLAKDLNLLVTCGSDYHGINTKPDTEIGTGINNNLKIKELSIISKLK